METAISAGIGFLTVGFVLAFVGFAGWKDAENFAIMNSWIMYQEDTESQEVYGKLVAGTFGFGGCAFMLFGAYLMLSPLLN